MTHGLARVRTVNVRSLRVVAAHPVLRRLLVVCGLVVAGWLLGGLAGTAHADVRPSLPVADGAVQGPGIVERMLPAATPPAGPALPGAGSALPETWPADDDPRQIGDTLPERLPEIVNPPGGQGGNDPDLPGGAGGTVPADPGGLLPSPGGDRAADIEPAGSPGSYTAAVAETPTGKNRHADRLSPVRADEDAPSPPTGGDRLLPAAGPAPAGAGGLAGGYLAQTGRAERPQAVPSARPAMDAPVVRTAVDEPSFAPD